MSVCKSRAPQLGLGGPLSGCARPNALKGAPLCCLCSCTIFKRWELGCLETALLAPPVLAIVSMAQSSSEKMGQKQAYTKKRNKKLSSQKLTLFKYRQENRQEAAHSLETMHARTMGWQAPLPA
eukprot:1152209-Pelagomonas_calceolata.AAC.9